MTLRIIIKRSMQPASSNHTDTTWHTFLVEAPEVEAFISGGGMSPDSFDLRQFVGAEVMRHDVSGAAERNDG